MSEYNPLENHPGLWCKKLPQLGVDTHKYSRGQALIYGGTYMTGAARLSAMACARAGAGASTVACAEKVWPIYAGGLLSVMVKPWATEKEALHLWQPAYQAVLIGPGAGEMPELMGLVQGLLQQSVKNQTVVLDADAITIHEKRPQQLFTAIANSMATVVLTPHEGEFARLFPDLALVESSRSKVERAQHAAQRSGAIIVLKGSETVIAHPKPSPSCIVVQKGSSPYLATAGSGDVLAGLITGLGAQAMPAFSAACTAVWLHSQAAQAFGPGLIAEDIIENIPLIWQHLLSNP